MTTKGIQRRLTQRLPTVLVGGGDEDGGEVVGRGRLPSQHRSRPAAIARYAGVLVAMALIVTASGCAPTTTAAAPKPVITTPATTKPPVKAATHAQKAEKTRKRRHSHKHVRTTPGHVATSATPAGAKGSLTLITEPDQGIGPIDAFLRSPAKTLDLTMYELVDTNAEQILAGDASRGVTVRVVLDQNRERSSNTPAYDYLASHGVHVRWAPSSYEATHEKAAVVDAGRPDARALIMTLNLTSRYYSMTRDFAVIDTGAADVKAIEDVFDADYDGRTSASTPSGTDLIWSPGSQPALVSLIDSAQRTLAVENEEMSDPAIIDALVDAAHRGVNVKVTMTADSEWDTAFDTLTAAGAHVHLFPDTSTALYIHAKVIVADGTRAFVGSENFSDASLDDNRELGLLTGNHAVVSGLAATLAADYAAATDRPGSSPSESTPPPAANPPPAPGGTPLRSPSGRLYRAGEDCSARDLGLTTQGSDGTITCEATSSGYNRWVKT